MAPATRSQARKTRSGAQAAEQPQAAHKPATTKVNSKKRTTPTKEKDVEEPATVEEERNITAKKQKLENGNAKPVKVEHKAEAPRTEEAGESKGTEDGTGKGDGDAIGSEQTTKDKNQEITGGEKEEESADGRVKGEEEGEENEEKKKQQQQSNGDSKKEDEDMKDAPAENENNAEPKTEDKSESATVTEKKEKDPLLEKGLFYFFARNKVDVDEASSVKDIQRSYMVMRPIPPGQGPSDEKETKGDKSCRALIIPRKSLPSPSSHQREISYVDKANVSLTEIRDQVLAGYSYSTKTKGEREVSAAQPIAEGVYAIVKGEKDRQSHFAYILTYPDEVNEVVQEFGLKKKGSFIISVRNPKFEAPVQARGLPSDAEFSKEALDAFGDLRWTGAEPMHLDTAKANILWIGEKSELPGATKEDAEAVKDEMEKIGEEDESRIEQLKSSDPIFADLELSKKDFEALKTSWE